MLSAFKKYIEQKQLFTTEDNILVAVSGGVDSMVLCNLLLLGKYNFSIAHCNFKLREKESDLDEVFVKSYAHNNAIPFYNISFSTKEIAEQNKTSIQLTARNLRYDWFGKIMLENSFQLLATAHHLSDSIETVLFNFTKACGIRGLHGILAKKNNIVRPLLFATKESIQIYAKENNIAFRTDLSNNSIVYHRNLIRHEVIPELKKINPSFEQTAQRNIERFKEVEALLDFLLIFAKEQLISKKDGITKVDLERLKDFPSPATLVYELIKEFGYNSDQIRQILFQKHQTGVEFFSPTHRLIYNRKELLIAPKEEYIFKAIQIKEGEQLIENKDFNLKISHLREMPNPFPNTPNIAFLDKDKLSFPLTIRTWKAGDSFQAFGMNGQSKKLKDFLTNLKLSRFEKEKVLVLESGNQIHWVIGFRISQLSCLTKKTKSILKLRVTFH